MTHHKSDISCSGITVLLLVLINTIIAETAFIDNENLYWAFIITIPLLLIAIYDSFQKKRRAPHSYPEQIRAADSIVPQQNP